MDPLLIDIPEQLETERLIIRAPRAGDGPANNEAVLESLNELRPWMIWANPPPTIEQSEGWARKCAAKFMTREELHMRVLLKKTGEFVGGCGFVRLDWRVPKFEIGYWCRTRFSGQGYITESVQALTSFALDSLKAQRVEIHADERNVKSWKVAERCGFHFEGTHRNDSRAPSGELRSTRIYAKYAGGG